MTCAISHRQYVIINYCTYMERQPCQKPFSRTTLATANTDGCYNANLVITWTVSGNGNSQITNYTLKWGKLVAGSMQNTTIVIVSDDTSLAMQGGKYTLDELESDTPYGVQVEAANKLSLSRSLLKNKTTLGM